MSAEIWRNAERSRIQGVIIIMQNIHEDERYDPLLH